MKIIEKSVRFLLSVGISVDYKKLSICRIERGLGNERKVQFQVDCNYRSHVFSHLYDDIDIAVDKFLAIMSIMNKDE